MKNKDAVFILYIISYASSIAFSDTKQFYISALFIIILGILTMLQVKNKKFNNWLER